MFYNFLAFFCFVLTSSLYFHHIRYRNCAFLFFASDWSESKIDGLLLPETIQCWESKLSYSSTTRYNSNIFNGGRIRRDVEYDEYPLSDEEESDELSSEEADETYTDYGIYDYGSQNIDHTTCKQKLVEKCPIPQCNESCPKANHQGQLLSAATIVQALGSTAFSYLGSGEDFCNMCLPH